MDSLAILLVSFTFGLLVTAHVRLLAHLAFTPPRWRAGVALLLPPLAPFWSWPRHRVWCVVWLASGLFYAASFIVSTL